MTPAQFLELLLSLSLQAAIIVVATHWVCRFVEAPGVQCRLWNLCHILLLLLVAAGLLLPHVRLVHPWQAVAPETAGKLAAAEATLGRIVFWGWASGAGLSLALLAREWTRALRFLKTCAPADKSLSPLSELLERAESQCDLRSEPETRILTSPFIGSPFCCQWHQPQVVLPEFLRDRSPDELEFVVRHELAHLSYGHPLQLFLQRLVETVFWFHPLVHWASRQSSLSREFACDDAAVTNRREVVGYLKMLLDIAEQGQTRESEGALLFFGRGASVVALRGRRLVKQVEAGRPVPSRRRRLAGPFAQVGVALAAAVLWAPFDVLASSRARWSPWPTWSAGVLRTFDIPARDYEPYETRTRSYELEEHALPAAARVDAW